MQFFILREASANLCGPKWISNESAEKSTKGCVSCSNPFTYSTKWLSDVQPHWKARKAHTRRLNFWLQRGVLKTAVLCTVLEPAEKPWRRAYPVCFLMPGNKAGGRRNKRPAHCWKKESVWKPRFFKQNLESRHFSPCIGEVLVSFRRSFGVSPLEETFW